MAEAIVACPQCGEVHEQQQQTIDLQSKRITALEAQLRKAEDAGPLGPSIEEVFDHWVETHEKNPKRTVLGERRKQKVRARLRELVTKSELKGKEAQREATDWLKEAVDGCLLDDWAMGRIRKTQGKTFNDLADHICESESSVQKFRELWHRHEARMKIVGERRENEAAYRTLVHPSQIVDEPPLSYPQGLRIVMERLGERNLQVKGSGARYSAQCPAHEDRSPSLSILEKPDGRVLLHCHAGCKVNDVLAELQITFGEIGPFGPSPEFVIGRGQQRLEEAA